MANEENKYYCKCGADFPDKKKLKAHVFENAVQEPGQHGQSKEKPTVTVVAPLPTATGGTQAKEIIPAPPPEIKTSVPRIKKIGGRRWWLVWLGIGLLGVSIPLFLMYNAAPSNTIMAVVFVLFFASGAGCLWYGLKKREEGVYFKQDLMEGRKPFKGRANCLNIYYDKDKNGKTKTGRIAFEQFTDAELLEMKTEGRLGKYQKWRQDGNWYFVHEQDPKDGRLYPMALPDQVYFNPRELPIPLTMPASHKYAKPKPSTLSKLKPILVMGAILIMAIVIIATGAPAPA